MSPRKGTSISLLELETAAMELAAVLQSETTPGHKRLLFFAFFRRLALLPEPRRFRSYYLQFAPALPEVTRDLNGSCWDPVELEHWLEDMPLFREFAGQYLHLIDAAGETIRAAALLQALYAGDEAAAARLSGISLCGEIAANRSRLEIARNLLPDLPPGLRNQLESSVHQWGQQSGTFSADKIYMMLIDVGALAANRNGAGGILLPLYVSGRERPADAEEDLCQLNNQVDFGKHALYWTLLDGIQAARKLLPGAVAKWHYALRYSIPEKSADLNGTSLGLAAALLGWSAALNCYHKSPAIKLGGNVAVTGGIDPEGGITAVDATGLRAKITAAFFSPVDRLYIPAANWHEAMQIQTQLDRRYARRQLLIHPLDTLGQALQDRNLVERTRPGFARRTIALLRRKRSRPVLQILTLFILVALLIANLPAFRGWLDQTPKQFEFHDEEMIVRNAAGHTLWSHRFDFQPTASAYAPEKGTILVDDLDGDGQKETVLGTHETRQTGQSATLYAFSSKGALLWPPLRLGRTLETEAGQSISDFYHTNQILSASLEPGKPKALLVCIAHTESYPSCLALVTPSGEVSGAFWNAGHIISVLVDDLDRDGHPAFLAGGYDNEAGLAWVAVLHPHQIQGAAPRSKSRYRLAGLPTARPALLLRFPPSPFWTEGGYCDMTCLLESSRGSISIHIANPGFRYGLATTAESVMYGYRLDNDLKSVALHTLPDFFNAHYLAHYKHRMSLSELQRLLQVERWNGSDWIPFPARYGPE